VRLDMVNPLGSDRLPTGGKGSEDPGIVVVNRGHFGVHSEAPVGMGPGSGKRVGSGEVGKADEEVLEMGIGPQGATAMRERKIKRILGGNGGAMGDGCTPEEEQATAGKKMEWAVPGKKGKRMGGARI
jgi:hypothetical protein